VLSDQDAFRAPHGRQAGQHADMARDAEAARMGKALPVAHQDVRPPPQFPHGGQ